MDMGRFETNFCCGLDDESPLLSVVTSDDEFCTRPFLSCINPRLLRLRSLLEKNFPEKSSSKLDDDVYSEPRKLRSVILPEREWVVLPREFRPCVLGGLVGRKNQLGEAVAVAGAECWPD